MKGVSQMLCDSMPLLKITETKRKKNKANDVVTIPLSSRPHRPTKTSSKWSNVAMYISSDFFVRQTSIRFIIVASLFIAVREYVREEMLPVSCVIDRLVSMGCRAPDCCAEVVLLLFLFWCRFYPISLHLFFVFAGRSMSACWIWVECAICSVC